MRRVGSTPICNCAPTRAQRAGGAIDLLWGVVASDTATRPAGRGSGAPVRWRVRLEVQKVQMMVRRRRCGDGMYYLLTIGAAAAAMYV